MEELDALSQAPDFWDDADRAQALMQERGEAAELVEGLEEQGRRLEEALVFLEMSEEVGGDEEAEAEAQASVAGVSRQIASLETRRMLSGEHDDHNAVITIKPGSGGTESQDWAEMLLRMYTRYCEGKGWQVELADVQPGEEAGIKGADLRIVGPMAYGYLKAERGVHRLVRISPFDSAKRRHTSFAALTVAPEVDDDIDIEIHDSDIEVQTFRASGAGGQHVNKTDSAVRMIHRPTGVVVACQSERSQHKNRATALKMLRSKLYERELEARQAAAQDAHANKSDIAFGSQIRNYVLHPYKQVKDLRTGVTSGNAQAVLDGELDEFIEAFLLRAGSTGGEAGGAV